MKTRMIAIAAMLVLAGCDGPAPMTDPTTISNTAPYEVGHFETPASGCRLYGVTMPTGHVVYVAASEGEAVCSVAAVRQ